jgi:hypothetical protein
MTQEEAMHPTIAHEDRVPRRPRRGAVPEARGERTKVTDGSAAAVDVSLLPAKVESDGLAHGGRPRRVAVPIVSHDLIVRVPVSPRLQTTVRRITRAP